ncbi:MAG: DNA repair protein RadC [Alphaproteobacteria bacterium]|nr:DNA repair protein RadC [Alphaproteobacteria bacterium]
MLAEAPLLPLGLAKAKPHHTGHRSRLRARFLKSPEAIPDYELLEIILFPARPVGDVKPLAKALLARFGTLSEVMHAEVHALKEVEDINDAAVAAIKAVQAASLRLLREEAASRPVIQSWTALMDYCRMHLKHKKHEEFHVLFLNRKFGLLADEMQQQGTVDHAPVYPREVVKRALELGATGMILVHNHPSGDATPSKADIDITKAVADAARPLHITVHDHLVIGAREPFSFKAHGLL